MLVPYLENIDDIEEPNNIENFVMGLVAYIGVKGEIGSDCFYFRIVTPKRLEILYNNADPIVRSLFIVNGTTMQENIEYVTKEVNRLLLQCARETWEETALAINYYLDWEYYDPSIGICDYYLQSRNLKKQQFYIE